MDVAVAAEFSRTRRLAAGLGAAVVLLGAAVLAGWLLGVRVLVQPVAGGGAMQPQTALALAVEGAALFLAGRGRRGKAAVVALASLGVLTALASLAHHAVGPAPVLGAPAALLRPADRARLGPMALQAAAALLLAGLGLLAGSGPAGRRSRTLRAVLATGAGALALVALLGHLLDVPAAYAWGALTGMAVHTAAGLMALAGGLLALAGADAGEDVRVPWLPVVPFAGVLAGSVALSGALVAYHRRELDRAVEDTLRTDVSNEIRARLESRVQALTRLAQRTVRRGLDDRDWEFEAGLILQDYRSLRSITLTDAAGRELRQVGRPGLPFDLPPRIGSQEATATSSFPVPEGGRAVAFLVPLSAEPGRYIVAVSASGAFFAGVLAEGRRIAPGYGIEVRDGAHILYQRDLPFPSSGFAHEARLNQFGRAWTVRVWPGPEVLRAQRTPAAAGVLAFGAVVAAALAAAVRLAQVASARARALENARRQAADQAEALSRVNGLLAEANRELEAFGYSASHDLRAPLRAIEGYAGLLERHAGPGLDPEGGRLLEVIRGSAREMSGLLDGLLALSRVGRGKLEDADVDMRSLAESVLGELRSLEPGRDVAVSIAALDPARGDRTLLRQVWGNLLSNAIKFTRKRPDARVEVGSRADGAEILYFVRDNGAGFDPRQAGRLFGVFQRLHRPADFGGTGIGLAIVQRVVNRHGGRVWAEGRPENGATFYFTLPQKRTEEAR